MDVSTRVSPKMRSVESPAASRRSRTVSLITFGPPTRTTCSIPAVSSPSAVTAGSSSRAVSSRGYPVAWATGPATRASANTSPDASSAVRRPSRTPTAPVNRATSTAVAYRSAPPTRVTSTVSSSWSTTASLIAEVDPSTTTCVTSRSTRAVAVAGDNVAPSVSSSGARSCPARWLPDRASGNRSARATSAVVDGGAAAAMAVAVATRSTPPNRSAGTRRCWVRMVLPPSAAAAGAPVAPANRVVTATALAARSRHVPFDPMRPPLSREGEDAVSVAVTRTRHDQPLVTRSATAPAAARTAAEGWSWHRAARSPWSRTSRSTRYGTGSVQARCSTSAANRVA